MKKEKEEEFYRRRSPVYELNGCSVEAQKGEVASELEALKKKPASTSSSGLTPTLLPDDSDFEDSERQLFVQLINEVFSLHTEFQN